MADNLQRVTDWLSRQSGDKIKHIARWCEHGYGDLTIKQRDGIITEIGGFKYPSRKRQEKKLIE